MFDVVKKLMFARQIQFEKGKITLLGHPVLMCPVATFIEIRKELERKDSTSILYFAAKKAGEKYANTLKNKFGMKSRELIKWGMDTISLAGWGNSELIKFDPENKVAIMTYDSTFSKLYGYSNEPIDDIFRGFAASVACACFGSKDVEGVEVKCKSKGDVICEFIFKEKIKFDFSDKSIKKQLKR